MTKTVEFYFDYGSPATYLAWTQLPGICHAHGATLAYRPMLLGGVFKASGNQTPMAIPAKGRWLGEDLARFARRYGVPYQMNPYFIINTLPLMRGVFWAQATGVFEPYNNAMFRAMWVDAVDLNNPTEIARVVNAAGLDAAAMAKAIGQDAIKQALVESTNGAVVRGVFGAPTMWVDGELHFGQDRLDWVTAALARA